MYLVTAYFDEKTEKRLRGWIDKVSAATGNGFMKEHRVPPHLTLAAIEARSAEDLLPGFRRLQGKLGSGGIEIVTVGALFPYVIYAAPVLNSYLQELHGKICEMYSDQAEVTINRFYRHDSWFPHITLGKTLDQEQMRSAFAVMQTSFAPLQGKIVRIALSRVNPHEDMESIFLAKNGVI